MDIDVDKVHELAKENLQATRELSIRIEQQEKEIREKGETSKETRQLLDKATSDIVAVGLRVSDIAADMEKQISDLQAKLNRTGMMGGGNGKVEWPKTLGELFTEGAGYKTWTEKRGTSDWVDVGSFTPHLATIATHQIRQRQDFEQRAGNILYGVNLPDLVDLFATMRLTQIMTAPIEQARLTDFMTILPISGNGLEYPQESEFNLLYSELTANAASGQADIVVGNGTGFIVGSTVVVGRGTVAQEEGIVEAVVGDTITLEENLGNNHLAGAAVTSNVYGYTPETFLKPQASWKVEMKTATVKTIATTIPITEQMLEDVPMLQPFINQRLLEGLRLQRDRNLLYGDGSANQLNGLFAEPLVQTYSWSAGETLPVPDTRLDAIRRGMTLVRLAHYDVDLTVLNPIDWEHIELTKGTDGHYILSTGVVGAQRRVWGSPVLVTTAIEPGEWVSGAFRMGGAFLDRRQARIRVGQPNDDFLRNMFHLRAEERNGVAWFRPESFVHGTFDTAPS